MSVKRKEGEPELSNEELERRTEWFNNYVTALRQSVVEPAVDGQKYACPCCHNMTLEERRGFEICPVCFWEDDGQDEKDADVVRGGPNGSLSLSDARSNYLEFGACERRFVDKVRKPSLNEIPNRTVKEMTGVLDEMARDIKRDDN